MCVGGLSVGWCRSTGCRGVDVSGTWVWSQLSSGESIVIFWCWWRSATCLRRCMLVMISSIVSLLMVSGWLSWLVVCSISVLMFGSCLMGRWMSSAAKSSCIATGTLEAAALCRRVVAFGVAPVFSPGVICVPVLVMISGEGWSMGFM